MEHGKCQICQFDAHKFFERIKWVVHYFCVLPYRLACSWLVAVSKSVEYMIPVWVVQSFIPGRVKSKTCKIGTYRFLASCPALLWWGEDWLDQCQDNVTEQDIRSWWPDFPVRQRYKVAMSVHCHKPVPVLIRPYMLVERKATTNKHNVTEWEIKSWYQWPGLPVGQYYKVAMSVHCH